MLDHECETADRRSELIVLYDPAEGISRKLVTRRKHFFSKHFDIEVVEDGPEIASRPSSSSPFRSFKKSEIYLVLMIIALAVPALLYSIA